MLRLATIVQQKFGLIKVFFLTGEDIQTGQSHLGNLMTRHYTSLSWFWTHLPDNAVGITFGNVEELRTACSLIVGAGGIHHVSEVVEFVARMLLCCPASVGSPSVRMLRVDGTGGIEITVRFLGGTHHIEHGVDISLQFGIGISLEYIRGTFDGLIDIGVIE